MNKEQLQAHLTGLNIPFDKRWGVEKLEKLLPITTEQPFNYTDEQIDEIAKEVSGQNTPTFDEMKKQVGLTKTFGGELQTQSGLIVPPEALAHLHKTVYNYQGEHTDTSVRVYKVDQRGNKEFIREYSLDIHGKDYAKLAKQFTDQYR